MIEACISITVLLRRFLGLGVVGRGARAVRREAATQCAYPRYVENQRPGLELALGAASRYQRVLRRQDVEIRGERSLVPRADELVRFRRGLYCGPGGGEFLIEGLATRGCIGHLAQRRRERPVVRGDGGVILRACALKLALEAIDVEDRQ